MVGSRWVMCVGGVVLCVVCVLCGVLYWGYCDGWYGDWWEVLMECRRQLQRCISDRGGGCNIVVVLCLVFYCVYWDGGNCDW